MTKVDESDPARDPSPRRSEQDGERSDKRQEDSTFRDILRRKRRRDDRRETGRRRDQTNRRRRRQTDSETSRTDDARSERDRSDEQRQTERSRKKRTGKTRRKSNQSGSGAPEDATGTPSPGSSEAPDGQTGARTRGPIDGSSTGPDSSAAPRVETAEGAETSEAADSPIQERANPGADHPSNDSPGEVHEPQSEGVASGTPSRRASADRVEDVERIREISRQIVDAVRQGNDQHQRQVVFVDAQVPGGGNVRIRLRRDGGAFEARMRADSDGLARTLRHHESELRDAADDSDVTFSSIDIVS